MVWPGRGGHELKSDGGTNTNHKAEHNARQQQHPASGSDEQPAAPSSSDALLEALFRTSAIPRAEQAWFGLSRTYSHVVVK